MNLLLLFSLLLFSVDLFPASYMVASVCAEKGSCRNLHDRQALLEEDSCPACKDLQKYPNTFLRKPENRKLWHGVCLRKNPPNDGSYNPKNRLLDETTARVGRSRKRTKHFVAAPSKTNMNNNAKMEYERRGKEYISQIVISKIRNDPDPRFDRAYAQRCIDRENQENLGRDRNAMKLSVTIPNGGKSKSARSKQNRTLGAIINQTSKALAQDKATPNRYQAEGINNALKSMLPIERGAYELIVRVLLFELNYVLTFYIMLQPKRIPQHPNQNQHCIRIIVFCFKGQEQLRLQSNSLHGHAIQCSPQLAKQHVALHVAFHRFSANGIEK